MLLVHGFGSSGRANWSATGWLRDAGRAGIATATVDLRGHGLSAKPHDAAAYSRSIVLQDLQHVLAALPAVLGPLPAIDLVGYSMGGRLVAELVASSTRSPDHPSRVVWDEELPTVRRAVIGGYDGRPLFDSVEFEAFTAALAGEPGPESPGRRVAGIALAGLHNDLDALSALVKGFSTGFDPFPPEAVRVPALVVAGDRDMITDHTRHWAAGMPDAVHLDLPGRNHVNAVTSSVFRSAALEFLAG